MKRRILILITIFLICNSLYAQTISISNASVTGRFNSCSGSTTPTITATLISTAGGASISSVGGFVCLDPCDSSILRIEITNIRWNKSPNSEWLHGIYFPTNSGFNVSPVNIPAGFMPYNIGCVGTCPSGSGTNGGPGFYYDGTGLQVCCPSATPLDGIPCNNYGDPGIACNQPFSLKFDLKFCNSVITGSSYEFSLRGTCDGETGCWNLDDNALHEIKFTIPTTPCSLQIIAPSANAVVRSCTSGNVNYTSQLSATCSGNNVRWWDAATGGNLLGTGSPFIYDPAGSACPAGSTIYATCCSGNLSGCIARVPIIIPGTCEPPISISSVSSVNSTCNLLGSINGVNYNNSVGSVNYSLQPIGASNGTGVFNNLNQTSYTVTVSDATDCSASTVVNILQPPIITLNTPILINPNCVNANSGSISITAAGGGGGISYSISPSATQSGSGNFINLSSQNYTITATDGNNCTATTIVNLLISNTLVWNSINVSNTTCNLGNNGSLQVNASGGIGIINYNLQAGNINSTLGNFNSLTANVYTVQANDGSGCTITTILTVTQPLAINFNSPTLTPILCNGSITGSIIQTATGGTGTISYTLEPGNVSSLNGVYNNLSAGNYTITAKDANNCTKSTTINITQPSAISFNTPTLVNVSCHLGTNGSITQTAIGGTGTLSYNLMPGNINSATGVFGSLIAGSYTITVKDANNCTMTTSLNIAQPSAIVWNTTTLLNVSCHAGSNASMEITATGGTGSLSYNLMPGNINNATGSFTSLVAGTYTVTMKDANNCTKSSVVNISQPILINWNAPTISPVTCHAGTNGSIGLTATGGTGTLSYNLMPGNITNSSGTFTSLVAGAYTITVTDANSCTITSLVNITQPSALAINAVTNTIPTCVPGSDGSLTVTASGGTIAYQYNIGAANQNSNGLNAGTFTVTVTDANSCTATSVISIIAPNSPAIANVVATNLTCFNNASGSIHVTTNGGTGILNYNLQPINISNPNGQFNSLIIGSYTVIVTDAVGCSVSSISNISQPTQLTIDSVQISSVSCNTGTDGVVTAFVSGGTMNYNYLLLPNNISNTNGIFNNLNANSYTIQVTDVNNCSNSTSINIAEPALVVWNNVSQNNVSCFNGQDASITANATGGTGIINYTLQPSNVNNTAGSFSNLQIGTFTITASDANNCSISTSITITQPTILNILNIALTTPSCVPGSDGSLTVTASGGTIAYQYNIGAANQNSNVFNGLNAGTFTVTVTDANSCTATSVISIIAPNSPIINSIALNLASCNPSNDGTATIAASNGIGLLTYSLNGINFQTTNSFNNLSIGSYTVVVKDAIGCNSTDIITISTQPSPTISAVNTTLASCQPGCDASISINANGGTSGIFTFSIDGINFQANSLFQNVCAASYTVTVLDGNGCNDTALAIVNTANSPIINSIITTNVSCFGLNDGSATIAATGGTGLLDYSLQGVGLNNNFGQFNNLAANNYTLVVSDANGCSTTNNLVIVEPSDLLFYNVTSGSSSCSGVSNGVIIAATIGGMSAISYTISPNANFVAPNSFVNITGNVTYTVVASDVNGCSISTTIFVSQPSTIQINSSNVVDVSCNGANNGEINVIATGGTGTLSYTINPNGTSNTTGNFVGLNGNTYTITITDANNCTTSTILNVVEPNAITISNQTIDNISCNNVSDGSIQFSCIGGVGNFIYNLLPTATSNTSGLFTNLSGNIYTLQATDANNCTISTMVNIINPFVLSIDSLLITNALCFGQTNGALQTYVSGGTGTYNYLLLPININNLSGGYSNLASNNYTISVSDANNCTSTSALFINQPPTLSIQLIDSNNVTCANGNNGSIEVIANGGTPQYVYTIFPSGDTSSSGVFNNLNTGTYTIQASDDNGCSTQLSPITLSSPAPIVFTSVIPNNISCYGDSTGSINVAALGGVGIIAFSINPNLGVQNQNGVFTNLPANSYIIIATDAIGCTNTTFTSLTQNPALTFASIIYTEPICYGDSNGTINAIGNGGNGTIYYQLNNGLQSLIGWYPNLPAATYTLTITDVLGCTKDSSYQLIQPDPLGLESFTFTPITCKENRDAKAYVKGKGGKGFYTYYIRPGLHISHTGYFGNLTTGTYTLTIKDTNGCEFDTLIQITPPGSFITVNVTKQDLTCYGIGNEGWAKANVIGGEAPYNYTWSTNPLQNTEEAIGLYFGYYFLTVSDANDCVVKDTIYIEPGPCCEQVFLPNAFSPNGDGRNDVFKITTTAGIELKQFSVFDRWGNEVWKTYNFRDTWDGSYDGEYEDMNTFFYVFKYKCLTDGNIYMKKGDIMLVR
jgi:gliding motility-associated-like protein